MQEELIAEGAVDAAAANPRVRRKHYTADRKEDEDVWMSSPEGSGVRKQE